jgi:hypothetical protein
LSLVADGIRTDFILVRTYGLMSTYGDFRPRRDGHRTDRLSRSTRGPRTVQNIYLNGVLVPPANYTVAGNRYGYFVVFTTAPGADVPTVGRGFSSGCSLKTTASISRNSPIIIG